MENDSVKNELASYLEELSKTDDIIKNEKKNHIEELKKSMSSLKENPNKVTIKEKNKKSFIKWLFSKK